MRFPGLSLGLAVLLALAVVATADAGKRERDRGKREEGPDARASRVLKKVGEQASRVCRSFRRQIDPPGRRPSDWPGQEQRARDQAGALREMGEAVRRRLSRPSLPADVVGLYGDWWRKLALEVGTTLQMAGAAKAGNRERMRIAEGAQGARGGSGGRSPAVSRRDTADPARRGAIELTRVRPHAGLRNATAVAAIAGLVFVAQQALPLVNVSTRAVFGLIAAALVGVLGLLVTLWNAQRSEEAERAAEEREVDALLACWPPPKVSQTNAYDLGTLPSAGDGVAPSEYIARTGFDAKLDERVREASVTLVVGATGAGKSRAAFGALSRTAGEWRVLVPENGASLNGLLALEPGRFLNGEDAVLWLDDVDRYLETSSSTDSTRCAGTASASWGRSGTSACSSWSSPRRRRAV